MRRPISYGKFVRCCNAGSRYAAVLIGACRRRTEYITATSGMNGGSLNGVGESETFILEVGRLSSSLPGKKSPAAMFYSSVWGRDYIVTAAIFTVCMISHCSLPG